MKAVLTQQVYDNEYEIVVSALVGIDPNDDDDLSDVATQLADAMADADHDVKTALLPSWRTWAAGADKIECGESKLLAAGEGSGHYGRVDIPVAVSVQTRYGTVPTGGNKVHVEISPIPKTTAGWEE